MSIPATAVVPAPRIGKPRSGRGFIVAWLASAAWVCTALAPSVSAAASPDGAAAAGGELRIGSQAPDFTATDSDGKVRRLADYRGKIVVLEWTNADCPYTRKHYSSGNMQGLQELARQRGIIWMSVISSAPGKQGYVSGPEANALSQSRHAEPAAVLLDPSGAVGRLYHARTTPHLFVIDARGDLQYMGGIDSIATPEAGDIPRAEPFLKEALLAVADGKPVAHPVTRPYGCSVKY